MNCHNTDSNTGTGLRLRNKGQFHALALHLSTAAFSWFIFLNVIIVMLIMIMMMMTVITITAGVVEDTASKISFIHLKNNLIHQTAGYYWMKLLVTIYAKRLKQKHCKILWWKCWEWLHIFQLFLLPRASFRFFIFIFLHLSTVLWDKVFAMSLNFACWHTFFFF